MVTKNEAISILFDSVTEWWYHDVVDDLEKRLLEKFPSHGEIIEQIVDDAGDASNEMQEKNPQQARIDALWASVTENVLRLPW